MEFFDVVFISVCDSDDSDLPDPVLLVERELGLGFAPETLFAFKGGRDDQLTLFGDIAMYPESFEYFTVFQECQSDHRVKLGDERLAGGKVPGKGEVKKDHLFATFLVAVVDEKDELFLCEGVDRLVEPVLGNPEALFCKGIDLVDGEVFGVVLCQYQQKLLFVRREVTLPELFHRQKC